MENKFIIITEDNLVALVDGIIEKAGLTAQVEDKLWVDSKEAQELLSVGKTTLYKLRSEGKITYTMISPKVFKYNRASLFEYIDSKTKKAFYYEQ